MSETSTELRKISRNGVSCTTGNGRITFFCARHNLTVVIDPDDPASGRKVHRFMLDHEDCTGGHPAVIDVVNP